MPANKCAGHRTDGESCGGQRKRAIYCRIHIGGPIARARAIVRAEGTADSVGRKTGLPLKAVLKEFLSDPNLALSPAQRAMFPDVARRVLGLETGPVPTAANITVNGDIGS